MKIKRMVVFTIFISATLLLVACRNEEINMPEEFVQGFIADDSKPLADILTRTYELQKLRIFFGEIPVNEKLGYNSSDHVPNLTINDVNEEFPIECLRRNHYVVYKVNEGGYFYVFWSLFIENMPEKESEHSIEDTDNALVYFTAYLSPSSLKKESDFDSIKRGISTAEDVATIDPAFELSFLMSSGIRSYSLLEDGSVMEIWYEHNDHMESRKDLLVKRKEVLLKETASSVSSLANILSKDLP